MTTLTTLTKVRRINQSFSKLVAEQISDGRVADAEKTIKVLHELGDESKERLFDILSEIK